MATQFRPELLPKIVERLRALADETRLRLLMRLEKGECNVATLVNELGVPQASVSKHLAVMRAAGIVEATRLGNQAIYRLHDHSVVEMCDMVCSGVIRHLQQEHQALARTLEGPSPSSRRRRK